MEDFEIRRLYRAEKMPIKVIAQMLGCSKNTVKAALAADGPPGYSRRSAGSIVDAVKPRIRELLAAYPTMPATVIAERVGWPYSIRTLSGRVAELRPVYLPPDPAGRTSSVAGEIGQQDFWFPDIELPVGCGQIRTASRPDSWSRPARARTGWRPPGRRTRRSAGVSPRSPRGRSHTPACHRLRDHVGVAGLWWDEEDADYATATRAH